MKFWSDSKTVSYICYKSVERGGWKLVLKHMHELEASQSIPRVCPRILNQTSIWSLLILRYNHIAFCLVWWSIFSSTLTKMRVHWNPQTQKFLLYGSRHLILLVQIFLFIESPLKPQTWKFILYGSKYLILVVVQIFLFIYHLTAGRFRELLGIFIFSWCHIESIYDVLTFTCKVVASFSPYVRHATSKAGFLQGIYD